MNATWHPHGQFTASLPPIVVTGVLVGLGVLFLLFGWKVYRVALVLAGAVVGGVFGAALAAVIGAPFIVLALLLAVVGGFLALAFEKVGVAILGGACGILLVSSFRLAFDSEGGYRIALFVGLVLGVVLALLLWRPMIVAAFSVLGSWLVACAVILSMNLIHAGAGDQLVQRHPYWIVAAFIALAVFGIYFQSPEEDEETDA